MKKRLSSLLSRLFRPTRPIVNPRRAHRAVEQLERRTPARSVLSLGGRTPGGEGAHWGAERGGASSDSVAALGQAVPSLAAVTEASAGAGPESVPPAPLPSAGDPGTDNLPNLLRLRAADAPPQEPAGAGGS